MAFEIYVDETNESPVIQLKDGSAGCNVEIYSFGALLNAFCITTPGKKVNVIDGFLSPQDAKENITNGFKSAKLSPFVCRMEKGEYQLEGVTHKIKKHYLGAEAIHGLLFDAAFTIKEYGTDGQCAFVKLNYVYAKKEEGFPFSFSVEILYKLSSNYSLDITTSVTNTGEKEMPLSDGWHPYFKLGESVNDLQMKINSNTMLEFDNRLLPSGNYINYNSYETMQPLNDTFLDNSFLLKNHDVPACILKNTEAGLELTITADPSYPYLQIYTPGHRKSIAVENLSSAPDAFNNGIGLIKIKPGQSYNFKTTYRLSLV